MWEINNTLQMISFARSVFLGIILCLIYDILRIVRASFDFGKLTIFFQDILFSVFSSLVTFLFLLSLTNGEIRAFVIVGMGVGFLISRLTISRIFLNVGKFIFIRFKKLLKAFSEWFYKVFDNLEKNITIFFKKTSKTVKKLLKIGWSLLYTKKNGKQGAKGNET